MSYRRYGRVEIVRFLRAVDDFLVADLSICMIGGVAAVLGYDAVIKTADIDVFEITNVCVAVLRQAAAGAADVTGIDLTIDRASIAQLPFNYYARLRPIRAVRFRKLDIQVPDKYDLVLSKMLRCYPHDLDAIESIHKHHPLSEKTLATRFEEEFWREAVGASSMSIALNMTLVMAKLFGDAAAETYKIRWGLNP